VERPRTGPRAATDVYQFSPAAVRSRALCFIASNDTVAGRTQNRRAEVVFQMSGEDLP